MQQPAKNVPLDQLPGFDRLGRLEAIFVSQKFELWEAFTGCETPNRYKIYQATTSGKDFKGKPLFVAEEKSNCCARLCCAGECRPFKVEIQTRAWGDNTKFDKEPFLMIDRPCKCTIYCFGRPEIKVYDQSKGESEESFKNFIGKIRDPWNLCDLVVDVYDTRDKIFKIAGSCCQLGLFCKFPCEACQTISFDIKNKNGDKVGDCTKRSKGCLFAMMGDADNFSMNFPMDAQNKEKALLMAAIIFIDFRFFEENPNNKKRRGGAMGN